MYLSDIHTFYRQRSRNHLYHLWHGKSSQQKRTETPWDFWPRPGNSGFRNFFLFQKPSFLSQKKIRHRYSLRSWTKHPGQCRTYRSVRWTAVSQNTEAYINAIKHPAVKILGHCDDTHFPVDYETLARAALRENVIFEINEASLAPGGYRGDTRANAARILYLCQKYQLPVILSSDSHGKEHVGDFTYAEEFVHQLMFPETLILNNQLPKLKVFLQTR